MTELQRVVFVEDDPDIRELIDIALNTIGGIFAVGFPNGQTAISDAAKHAPQMLLLDVMMPGIDGAETLKGLREQNGFQDVPVIFLTAKVHPSEIQRLRSLGADAVIAKPFDPMMLADELRSVWQEVVKPAI